MNQLSTRLESSAPPATPPQGWRGWEPPQTIAEAWSRLLRHKGKMALYFFGVMGLVSAVTFFTQPQYGSESKLFVRIGRENLGLDPTTTLGQGNAVLSAPTSREDEINSMMEMFESRSLLERLATDIGPDRLLDREAARPGWFSGLSGLFGPSDSMGDAIDRLKRGISISSQKRSNVLSVSYTASSPELAQRVVTRLVALYVDEYSRLHRVEGSKAFLANQAAVVRSRLEAAEARLREIKNKTGLTSVSDQRRILVERVGQLEDELLRTDSQLAVTEAELRTLGQRLKTLPSMLETERATGFSNEATDGMRQQLYSLQLKEQELLSKYKDNAAPVLEVRRQLEEARAILAREESNRTQVRSARNPAYQQLELSYLTGQTMTASLRAKREAMRLQLTQAKTRLGQLTSDEVGLAEAQRDVELEEARYRRYTDTTEQARVDEELEEQRLSNIGIIQAASLEPKPVSPRVVLNLSLGFLAALFGALAIGCIADFRTDDTREPAAVLVMQPDSRLLAPSQIRLLLDRQRVRSDRNGECFAIFLYSWGDKESQARCAVEFQALLLWRLRTTDDVGWFDENRLVALLHDTTPETAHAVADDIARRYPQHLPPLHTEIYIYPSVDSSDGSGAAGGSANAPPSRRVGNTLIALGTGLRVAGASSWPFDQLFVQPLPRWKRLLDISVSSLALIASAPLLLLAAAAIKLDSRGPVIFRQLRSGLGGAPFTIFKLRTMTVDAEALKAGLLKKSERDGPFKMKHDPRVTRVGRLLRLTSLDELPQFWNVLIGNMSLVGPRPLPLSETHASEQWQRQRLDVTPGLTGVWQVSGRAHIGFEQWVRMDVKYIRSRSLWQDIKLLIQTIPAVILRRGAH